MKSKLRRKITALMLCGAMIFSGSSSALADSPAGEIDENTIVQEEMIETVVEEADTEVTEEVTEEETQEVSTEETEETEETAETEEAAETEEEQETLEEETADEAVEEVDADAPVQEETSEEPEVPTEEIPTVEETKTIVEKVTEAVTEVAEAVVEVVEEVIRYIIGMHDDLTYVDENVTIKVYAEEDEIIPEGTKIKVVPILAENDETKAQYEEVAAQLEENAAENNQEIQGFLAYDITLVDSDGNEFEPYGEVKVTMEYKNAALPTEVVATEETEVTVLHFEEDENGAVKQIVDMVAEEAIEAMVELTEAFEIEKAEFVTESFSTYAVTWSTAAELTFYEQLMAAETCEEIFNLMMADTESTEALTEDELNALYEKVEAMEDDGYQTDVLDTLEYLMTDGGEAEILDMNNWHDQGGTGGTATSGTSDHIEVEISGTVTVTIGDETFEDIAVTLTTSDTYTVTAYTLDGTTKTPYTNFTYSGATEGNGSTDDATIELSGSYPTGTKSNQVYYVVSVVKTVTITLADGTVLDIPVTLTVTTSYWDEDNNCPGIGNSSTNWQNGYYINGSGIDVPISGEYVGAAITKGKLAISKTVTGEENSTATFQFYLQNAEGEYLVFSSNKYTGTTDTLTDECKVTVTAGESLVLTDIPVGTYTITEIQKDGYIVTDAEGNESDNYTKDYIVETKSDSDIPIAYFTNKKLSNEAGIKIKKLGYGLTPTEENPNPYPNPTVAIYNASSFTDGVLNDGAEAVWTGTLTTNSGEFIYLNTTLPAGNYVVVETNADKAGYNLSTTLTSSNTTISGMTFTAAENTVHELVVTNTYTGVTDVSVTKKWDDSNNTYGLRPASITVLLQRQLVTASESDTWENVGTYTISKPETDETNVTAQWTYKIEDLPIANGSGVNYTYRVVEETVPDGYTVAYDSDGLTITNTLKKLEIIKNWVDADNVHGTRPSSLAVTISSTTDEKDFYAITLDELKDFTSHDFSHALTIGNATFKVVHDGDWKVTIYGMDLASYTFTEAAVPGYSSAGPVVDSEAGTVTFTNTLNIQIVKQNGNSSGTGKLVLQGAKFKIEKTVDGTTYTYYAQSGEDGRLSAWSDSAGTTVTPDGTFTLSEVQAPAGYALSEEEWEITFVNGLITKVEKVEVNDGETTKTILALTEVSGQLEYEVSFVNEMLYELPSTGGLGIYVPMIGGVLMMMAAAMILMNNKRREVL